MRELRAADAAQGFASPRCVMDGYSHPLGAASRRVEYGMPRDTVNVRVSRVKRFTGLSVPASILAGLLSTVAACIGPLEHPLFWPLYPSGPDLPTVDGVEDASVAQRLHGAVSWVENGRHAKTIRLPDTAAVLVDRESDVCQVSGPDGDGRICFLKEHSSVFGDSRFELAVKNSKAGTMTVLSSFSAKNYLDLACETKLSPTNGYVAFRNPEVGLTIYPLDREAAPFLVSRGNLWGVSHLSWLPDGRRLMFECSVPSAYAIPGQALSEVKYYDSGFTPRLVSVVCAVDPPLDEARVYVCGSAPVVSTTGKVMLVAQGGVWNIIRLSDGTAVRKSIDIPGLLQLHKRQVLGFFDDWAILYEGLPTTGAIQEKLPHSAIGPGSKWTIKCVDVQGGSFCTLIPAVGHGWVDYIGDSDG
jgi:hypothetical protein